MAITNQAARLTLASAQSFDVIRALCIVGALFGAPTLGLAQTVTPVSRPVRVVSMNLCTDQLAMLVAGEGQLVSVSRIASDPRSSAMVEKAAQYVTNNGLAEEIYLMQPDLVVAGRFSSRSTISMLERLGIRVVTFDLAYELDDVVQGLRQMGEVLGQQERAADLIAEFETQLAAFHTELAIRPRAAFYYASGYTLGDKSLSGQILSRAGLDNIAAEQGFSRNGYLPLEVLAMARPDAVITSETYAGGSRAEEIMGHPVVEALRRNQPRASVSNHDWVCGTPFVLRAIGDMVALREQIQAEQP